MKGQSDVTSIRPISRKHLACSKTHGSLNICPKRIHIDLLVFTGIRIYHLVIKEE